MESYSLIASNIDIQFRTPGREAVTEQLLGIGLNPQKSRIKNLQFTAINENTLPSLMRDEVWFPEAILTQPLGKGTRKYDFDTVTDMLYDLEEYSAFDEPFDPINLLSGQPNAEKKI